MEAYYKELKLDTNTYEYKNNAVNVGTGTNKTQVK